MAMKWLMRVLVPFLWVIVGLPGTSSAEVNIGGDIVVQKNQTVESAVSVGGTVRVFGTVSDAAVSVGGKVIVEPGGRIEGDAISVGGGIAVRDSAAIGGDAISVGGSLVLAPSGTVCGEKVRAAFPSFRRPPVSDAIHSFARSVFMGPLFGFEGMVVAKVLFVLFMLKILIWLSTASLLYLFFQERADRMAAVVGSRFGTCFFTGFLTLFLIPIAVILLIMCLIGLPLIPFVLAFVFIMNIFGAMGVALWAGRLFPRADTRTGMLNIVLGILAAALLMLIPFAGFFIWTALAMLSIGVVVVTRFGTGGLEKVS